MGVKWADDQMLETLIFSVDVVKDCLFYGEIFLYKQTLVRAWCYLRIHYFFFNDLKNFMAWLCDAMNVALGENRELLFLRYLSNPAIGIIFSRKIVFFLSFKKTNCLRT